MKEGIPTNLYGNRLEKALNLLKHGCSMDSPFADLVRKTRDFLNKEWEVIMQSGYREGNRAAHWLAVAAVAHNQTLGLQTLDETPKGIKSILNSELGSVGLM